MTVGLLPWVDNTAQFGIMEHVRRNILPPNEFFAVVKISRINERAYSYCREPGQRNCLLMPHLSTLGMTVERAKKLLDKHLVEVCGYRLLTEEQWKKIEVLV